MLDDAQVRRFIEDGFVRIDRAFPREIADAGLTALWRARAAIRVTPQAGPVPLCGLDR